ncbi:MAG: NTP transferase domain-containing protein [Terriglobales bacterium]
MEAQEHIRRDVPVVVNYCDFSVDWDFVDFKRRMAELECAGCITAYRGFHPHSLGPNLYAYLREENNYLLEIREKYCFTPDRMNEYASSGTYYFRSGDLLLRYFQKAIERGLHTNGEFYASSPYNLLIEDGLDVYIYELRRMLQWGTPEDLEEYLAWSDYFLRTNERGPAKPAAGATLIPMAGAGERFAREGWSEPKPLVPVAGVPMIERALRALPRSSRWVAVCQQGHLHDPRLSSVLHEGRDLEIIGIDGVTQGQVCTCLLARDTIDPEQPLLVAPCDAALIIDESQYATLIDDPTTDCLIWTFRNHPHANRNPRQYGWVRAAADGTALEILCKVAPPDPVKDAPGITGAFWFRKARFLWEAADALIAQDRRVNHEFYADSAIQVLIEQRRRARVFPVKHFICFGTPDDVRTFEYWEGHFREARRPIAAAAAAP